MQRCSGCSKEGERQFRCLSCCRRAAEETLEDSPWRRSPPQTRCCTYVCLYSIKTWNSSGALSEREKERESLKLPLLLCSESSPLSSFRYLCCAYFESFCPPKQAAKLIGPVKHICQRRSRFILCAHDSNVHLAKFAKGINICGEGSKSCFRLIILILCHWMHCYLTVWKADIQINLRKNGFKDVEKLSKIKI